MSRETTMLDSFGSLPMEVLAVVFCYSSMQDLLKLRVSSKKLMHVVYDSLRVITNSEGQFTTLNNMQENGNLDEKYFRVVLKMLLCFENAVAFKQAVRLQLALLPDKTSMIHRLFLPLPPQLSQLFFTIEGELVPWSCVFEKICVDGKFNKDEALRHLIYQPDFKGDINSCIERWKDKKEKEVVPYRLQHYIRNILVLTKVILLGVLVCRWSLDMIFFVFQHWSQSVQPAPLQHVGINCGEYSGCEQALFSDRLAFLHPRSPFLKFNYTIKQFRKLFDTFICRPQWGVSEKYFQLAVNSTTHSVLFSACARGNLVKDILEDIIMSLFLLAFEMIFVLIPALIVVHQSDVLRRNCRELFAGTKNLINNLVSRLFVFFLPQCVRMRLFSALRTSDEDRAPRVNLIREYFDAAEDPNVKSSELTACFFKQPAPAFPGAPRSTDPLCIPKATPAL